MTQAAPPPTTGLNRQILALAVPALGSLIAEPAFLIVDAALIGHLGVTPLAGLGIASSVLQTMVGLMIFLAYATTPAVARRFGAGDPARAVSVGIDGMWLALGIGAILGLAGWFATPGLVGLFGAPDDVAAQARTYLGISMGGIPAMLIVFAATGLLRGMQNTITPLWIAGLGFAANAGLNVVLVYGLHLGIAGSAVGTVIAQWGMVGAYAVIAARLARRHRATLRPQREGMLGSARSGSWLFLRTLSLRIAFVLPVAVATQMGTAELAGFQIVFTLFSTAAFALDALAIAAQALVGKGLGAGDTTAVRRVMRRTLAWGVWFGVVVGIAIGALSGALGLLFTGDAAIAALIQPALLVLAVSQPLAACVFVLDGILIGAGDARYLGFTGLVNLAIFLPFLLAVAITGVTGTAGLAWLAASWFLGYLAARLLTLALRARGTDWMVAGATR